MTQLGEWLKRVPPLKAAVGFILLIASLIISVGASVMTGISIPARTTTLEVTVDSLGKTMAAYHLRDSLSTAELIEANSHIYCIVEKVFDFFVDEERTPINPVACSNEGEDQ